MKRREEDRCFERFARTGDPASLARVFDLVAPKLLLLAAHLARNPSEAEDLVQSTFVAAIESARDYDSARPVLTWLSGILANHVKRLFREQRRVPEIERLQRKSEATPLGAAQAAELTDEVRNVVDALPEAYRTVLLLRLLQGLEPVQIAHLLGRPPETVRTQVRRGLELLRKALPAGLAVSFVAAAPARSLAAVRAAVLARVGGAALPLSTLAATAGVVLMLKKLSAAVLALGGLAAVCTFALAPSAADPSVPIPGGPPVAAAAAESRPSPRREHAPAGERRVLPSPAADQVAVRATLRGRCVAAESGIPLEACTVTLSGQVLPHGDGSTPRERWVDPSPVTTSPDGTFAISFAVLPQEDYCVAARIASVGRVTLVATWRDWPPGGVDVGDVKLPRGTRVSGRVRDQRGAPLAAIELIVWGVDGAPFATSRCQALSAEDGTFDLGLLAAGTWPLEVGGGHEAFEPRRLVVPDGGAALECAVVVQRSSAKAFLSGTVVDGAGSPIPMAIVSARSATGNPVGGARAGPDGAFRIPCQGDPNETVTLDLAPPRGEPPFDEVVPPPETRFRPDVAGVRLTAKYQPRLAVELRVLEAETGRPVEEFAVRCCVDPRSVGRWSDGWIRSRLAGSHPDGKVTVGELVPGRQLLLVYPERKDLRAAGPLFFDLTAGGAPPQVVRLRRAISFPILVTNEKGSPIAGTRVELLAPWGDPLPDLKTWTVTMAAPFGVSNPPSLAIALDSAVTDAGGRASFAAPAGEPGLALRLLGPGHTPMVQREVTPVESEPLRVVVHTGSVLFGSLNPPGLVARLAGGAAAARPSDARTAAPGAGLQLRNANQRAERLPPTTGGAQGAFEVRPDGSYRIEGITPGTWEVRLFWRMPGPPSGTGNDPVLDPPIATVTLGAGEQRKLDLDARPFAPGRLEGRILVDGKPIAGASWIFRVQRPAGNLRLGGQKTDAEGRFASDVLLPGTYRLGVLVRRQEGGNEDWVYDRETFSLAPGDRIARTFWLESLAVRILLTEGDGKTPVRNRNVMLCWDEGPGRRFQPAKTDPEGVLLLDPPPMLPLELEARSPDCDDPTFWALPADEREKRTIRLGKIDAQPGEKELRLSFRLPAGAR